MSARINTPKPQPEPPRSAQAFTTPIPCTINDQPVATAWSYAANLPLSVKVLIRTPHTNVIWEFARSLLTDLTTPAGDPEHGDVTFHPVDDVTTVMRIRSDDSEAALRFDTEALRQFRNRTYALCLPGEEPAPDLTSLENVLRAAAEHTGGDW